ncbi:NF-kappa-B essential modulator isoform X2 [Agrilus planipennis]|uniref:NF-kappa-B essential modulator isoform X2 n=1 Tax=Agrilus planipennis TaxID=224129 RepID=A0A7F5RBJ5_AGRPL|nr:NF-kappa-B essential modulator isoform X2 [Agrilus planipennis]
MASSVVEENHKQILSKGCYMSSESDDEESFVVLSKSIPPNEIGEEIFLEADVIRESLELASTMLKSIEEKNKENSELATITKIEKPSESVIMQNEEPISMPPSISTDLSPDEIQHKIDDLIEENMKLKETLHQNNLAMKKKYETLVLWQEEVLKVHESHKERFAETKQYIEKLKLENARLTVALQNSDDQNTKQTTEMKQDDLSQKNAELVLELEKLKQEIAKLEKEKLNENSKQNCEKQEVELIKSSFENVKQFEIEMTQKKVTCLEAQLDQVQAENEELKRKNEVMELTINSIKRELDEAVAQAEKLRHDIDTQTRNQSVTVNKLLEENKSLQDKLNQHIHDKSREEMNSKVVEQLTAAQMHITKLELLRKQDLDTITSKQEEIQSLEATLKQKTTDDDTVAALRTQLDLYKADFEAERHQKNNLKEEKEQLADDLRHLQRRNQQLLEEVERLRNGAFVVVEDDARGATSTPSAPQDSPPPLRYMCPLCSTTFRSYKLIEEHMQCCLKD